MLTLTLTGGLACGTTPELVLAWEMDAEAVLLRRLCAAPYLERESGLPLPREGDSDCVRW